MSDGFEWLDWLEPSGPFLAPPVLKSAFPQGLVTLDPSKRKALRQAYDEYREALESEDPESDKFHAAWIDLVLRQGLEYDEDESGDNLKAGDDLQDNLVIHVAEHGVTLRPDYAVVDDQNADEPMMLIQVYDQDVDLNDAVRDDGWASSPRERMVRLCRDTDTRLGLITNGEHWLFVDAPVGAVSSFANWYARLWGPEPVLLQAFVVLLGIRRFFLAVDEQLPALIDKSAEFQDEVTEALGEQVRRAVEVLIQALDKADVDRNRELLKDVDPRELYEAGLTVMMRLVFLLSAEERELLLLGDERYEANYAVSTLRMQLRGEDESILQRRWDAWSRLLAIFRAIYGGIEHEALRMPALGGSLFDPDRFPFLEGRDKDSNWKIDPSKPLPIDNRTVLLLLDAIQLFEGRTLSYRGLDIEQLGYVYEGLLDHTVKRAKEVTLELDATKNAKQPWVTLGELESARLDGEKAVEKLLNKRTGSSISRVRNDLKKEVKPLQSMYLLTACHNEQELHDQLKQYFHLIRTDSWGRPLVYPEGSFMVTTGSDRKETRSHYTPSSLTEEIVRSTLEPKVFEGASTGRPRNEWVITPPVQILDLKICDPAMGSGAFLIQACRWLSDRLVESWAIAEANGLVVALDGSMQEPDGPMQLLSTNTRDRTVEARRLIAERCIYGVDINPLAVELAKLSMWLITLAKGKPFGFLDHNLRHGNSLIGVARIDQLTELSMTGVSVNSQMMLFGHDINSAVQDALEIRTKLRSISVLDISDVEKMASLDAEARERLRHPELIADALVGIWITTGTAASKRERSIASLAATADQVIRGDQESIRGLSEWSSADFLRDHIGTDRGRPFHWPLEFPEVFSEPSQGFDAVIANPPWGAPLTRAVLTFWKELHGEKLGRIADSFHLFTIRAYEVLRKREVALAGLLVPDVILYQKYSQQLREFILDHCQIVVVCNVGGGVFKGVTRPCCYIVYASIRNENSEISIAQWGRSIEDSEVVEGRIRQSALRGFPGCVIPTGDPSEFVWATRIVESVPDRLSSCVDELGIQRGASAPKKEIFAVDQSIAHDESLETEYLKPVVTGGTQLKPFRINGDLPLLIYTTRETPKEEISNIIAWIDKSAARLGIERSARDDSAMYALHRPRDPRIYERPRKLMGVITADRPIIAVDEDSLYAMDGVYVFAAREGIDAYYLAGVMNSDLFARLYRVFSQEEGRVMAQVKPAVIVDLPVIIPVDGADEACGLVSQISQTSRQLHNESLMDEDVGRSLETLNRLVNQLYDPSSTG